MAWEGVEVRENFNHEVCAGLEKCPSERLSTYFPTLPQDGLETCLGTICFLVSWKAGPLLMLADLQL
ncbi:hypothetical protein E2320_001265 [Naja naja]|nr:hypothetical protein E2320_001265 [Naja naja]